MMSLLNKLSLVDNLFWKRRNAKYWNFFKDVFMANEIWNERM